MRLLHLAKHCKYADVDKEILAHFVAHCNMEQFQLKALREDNLSLATALTLARGYERDVSSLSQLKHRNNSSTTVNFTSNQQFQNKQKHSPQLPRQDQTSNSIKNYPNHGTHMQINNQCKYCGNAFHLNKQQCPALGSQCLKCGKRNHFEVVCLSRRKQPLQEQQQSQRPHQQRNFQRQQQSYANNGSRSGRQQAAFFSNTDRQQYENQDCFN
jgi:hypothetical protein